ncbi:tRNA (adenine(58)-N(1))-methyltransferase non-catalytic subunit trm6 [Ophidiomyces ophidiicola]|nr:tRNA (adenine(58)-N(1))-methyltransferase non-catalytic subunit trm6 [Ophidiomyces ophidiicola]KAI1926469.1 tRNA (adenine(58)-N(1))-methyltransferase non-catalytic subunit trm6 [Ophidiomyces ophidiicola]KAI1931634.1 tRNA (adenine(58)-N(1))-methyltransferase non-catalytic subunit trm6 [Ophidiomyces ophidiicola]KAI1982835.1 tRNA (adenine(58)-N(1))-methyltransferase non-catalytic subunit trm6 [Ophidiomyces ophidiicola]KAI2013829.1 tRNA (adenine(58)-N(1))-methyltransferase non-catalytic subunit 
MDSRIVPNSYIALQLPSGTTKVLQVVPYTNISLGKYGSFPANQIIGRPFHLTFEILDEPDERGHVLRVVPAAELHTESLMTDGSSAELEDGAEAETGRGEDDAPNPRDNRNIQDDNSAQLLTMEEIENLKQGTTGAGKEIIAKLLQSHSMLDQKTAFSRAKYTLRKRRKYLKRFTPLPLDVSLLTNWMLNDKDSSRTMELRDELVGLIGCWANVHHGGDDILSDPTDSEPRGRWLMVDDTGGLLVAAMAERMGILYPSPAEMSQASLESVPEETEVEMETVQTTDLDDTAENGSTAPRPSQRRHREPGMSAKSTSITLIHPNFQPNLTFLKYFAYDLNDPPENHPLHTNLKTLSWIQLVDPESDNTYANEPAVVPDSVLEEWKPSKRGGYYRKRRRWTRVRSVVEETRAGGFDGLIVATLMDPVSVLKYTVPLLAGSAPVVVYSPHIEPLVKLADLYSTLRRAAYLNQKQRANEERIANDESNDAEEREGNTGNSPQAFTYDEEDFPVDPSLLLAPSIQTSRVRPWQVLPGRTHPLMTGRGGAEGYVFHATRVIPAGGKVEARGVPGRKKRKLAADTPEQSRASEADGDS